MAILAFHNVSDRIAPGITNLSPRRFRIIIERLVEYGHPIVGLQEYLTDSPDGAITLTFDDGLTEFHRLAFPILQDFDLSATVFVPAGYIGKKASWDYLSFFADMNHMNSAEIRELSENNIEIGSHGYSHSALTHMPPRRLKLELERSRDILEDITGRAVRHISYPFGLYNPEVEKMAFKCGFRHGLAMSTRRKKSGFTLGRFAVYAIDSFLSIKYKIEPGPLNCLEKYKGLIINSYSYGTVLLNRITRPYPNFD